MMLGKSVVILLIFVLCASGTSAGLPDCDENSCRRTCVVDDSCEPETVKFNAECDDIGAWGDNDVEAPEAEELCSQCCDENCEVQSFPNCTGENCGKCFDPSNVTESYDIHCCKIDGQYRCSLCTMPDGWNADWTTELESQLPDGAVFSFDDEDLCGDVPYQGECVTWDVTVISKPESCNLATEDIKCRGWYYSQKAQDCQKCLPRSNKVQFSSSSFERLTVQCKAGEAASCERVPLTILDVFVDCPSTDVCELDINGAFGEVRGRNFGGRLNRLLRASYGDPNSSAGGSSVFTEDTEFPFSFEIFSDRFRIESGSAVGPIYRDDSAPDWRDPVTGEIREHEICVLSLMAYAKDEQSSATVTMENLEMFVGSTPTLLGTFSHNSSDVGPTVEKFCFDAVDKFTGVIKVEGDFTESQPTRWSVIFECGTVPRNNCMFAPSSR